MSSKTVFLVNKKNRSYNGVRPGEVIEVSELNADGYLNFGFEPLETAYQEVSEVKVEGPTKAELEALLKEKGIEIPKKATKAQLEALLAGAGSKEGSGDTVDYVKLLTDAAIPFNEGDDLKKLAEENNLLA